MSATHTPPRPSTAPHAEFERQSVEAFQDIRAELDSMHRRDERILDMIAYLAVQHGVRLKKIEDAFSTIFGAAGPEDGLLAARNHWLDLGIDTAAHAKRDPGKRTPTHGAFGSLGSWIRRRIYDGRPVK